jgi:hypothetical protein
MKQKLKDKKVEFESQHLSSQELAKLYLKNLTIVELKNMLFARSVDVSGLLERYEFEDALRKYFRL